VAKFIFRLEPLRKFRENRLATARREMLAVQNQLADVADQRRSAFQERATLLENNDPADRIRASSVVEGATRMIDQFHKRMHALEEDLERHRRWVAHLGAELKAIEKLEEKQRAQFEEAEKLKEKRRADRWVAENWTRMRTNAGDVA